MRWPFFKVTKQETEWDLNLSLLQEPQCCLGYHVILQPPPAPVSFFPAAVCWVQALGNHLLTITHLPSWSCEDHSPLGEVDIYFFCYLLFFSSPPRLLSICSLFRPNCSFLQILLKFWWDSFLFHSLLHNWSVLLAEFWCSVTLCKPCFYFSCAGHLCKSL